MLLEPWQISLLGEVSARRSGQYVARFATRHSAALLGFLAYHLGRPQPREFLAELLWPEAEPGVGRSRLRVALASLRRQLEPPGTPAGSVLWSPRDLISLRAESCEVDASLFRAELRAGASGTPGAFEHLKRADETYGGEFMPGHRDDWALAARLELTGLQMELQLRLSEIYAGSADFESALRHARRAVAAEPLIEEPRATVMTLLIERGDRSAAEAELNAFRQVIRRRIGGSPSPELQAILVSGSWLRSESSGHGAKGRGQGEKSSGQRATGNGKRAEGNGQRATGNGKRAEGNGQRATGKGQGEKSGGRGEKSNGRMDTELGGRDLATNLALIRPAGAFVGREAEQAELRSLAAVTRVLTYTGPAGVGKTRLALEVAADSQDLFGAGILFLSADRLTRSARIVDRVLEELGTTPGTEDSINRLREILRSRVGYGCRQGFLLVVDDAEDLAGAQLVELGTIVREVATLTLVITSRRRLQLAGEVEFPVRPLATPGEGVTEIEALMRNPSVRLFVERARSAQPDFQVNVRNAPHIAEICRRCEGLPLAIELAAAVVRKSPPKRLASQMTESPIGRAVLDTALERSWGNLLAPLQDAMTHLSVFPISWDEEAASAALDIDNVREVLDELTSNSLIVRDTSGRVPRYRFLHAIRQFVGQKTAGEDLSQARQRHANHFLHRAELFRTVAMNFGPWRYEGLTGEHENLSAAFEWFLANDTRAAARLVTYLPLYFFRTSGMREGRLWISRITLPDDEEEAVPLTGHLKFVDGLWACQMDDSVAGLALLDEAIEIHERCGAATDLIIDRANQGFALYGMGRYRESEERFKLWLADSPGHHPWMDGAFRNLLGYAVLAQGRLDEALGEFNESVRISDSIQDPASAVHSFLGVARVAWIRGDLDRAFEIYRRCLKSAAGFGDGRACAYAAQGLGRTFASAEEWERAAEAFGVAHRIRLEQGLREDAHDREANEGCLERIRERLGDRFELVWQMGLELPREGAVAWLTRLKC